jgi:hypothetical protein
VGSAAQVVVDREGKLVRGIIVGVRPRIAPGLHGVVKEVKDRQLTITVRSRQGDTEETVTLPEKAVVLVDGKPGKLSDLTAGTNIEIIKDQAGAILRVSASGRVIYGTVKSLQDGKLTVVMRSSDEQTWTVAADATIIIDGKPAKLDDVKAERPVVLKLSVDGKRVLEIRSIQPRRGRE